MRWPPTTTTGHFIENPRPRPTPSPRDTPSRPIYRPPIPVTKPPINTRDPLLPVHSPLIPVTKPPIPTNPAGPIPFTDPRDLNGNGRLDFADVVQMHNDGNRQGAVDLFNNLGNNSTNPVLAKAQTRRTGVNAARRLHAHMRERTDRFLEEF